MKHPSSIQPPKPHCKGRKGAAGRVFHFRSPRNKTGRVGVHLVKQTKPNGNKLTRWFFCATLGRKRRNFSISSLGRARAWQEAVRCRMQWEHASRQRAALPAEARRLRKNEAGRQRHEASKAAVNKHRRDAYKARVENTERRAA